MFQYQAGAVIIKRFGKIKPLAKVAMYDNFKNGPHVKSA